MLTIFLEPSGSDQVTGLRSYTFPPSPPQSNQARNVSNVDSHSTDSGMEAMRTLSDLLEDLKNALHEEKWELVTVGGCGMIYRVEIEVINKIIFSIENKNVIILI